MSDEGLDLAPLFQVNKDLHSQPASQPNIDSPHLPRRNKQDGRTDRRGGQDSIKGPCWPRCQEVAGKKTATICRSDLAGHQGGDKLRRQQQRQQDSIHSHIARIGYNRIQDRDIDHYHVQGSQQGRAVPHICRSGADNRNHWTVNRNHSLIAECVGNWEHLGCRRTMHTQEQSRCRYPWNYRAQEVQVQDSSKWGGCMNRTRQGGTNGCKQIAYGGWNIPNSTDHFEDDHGKTCSKDPLQL